MSDHEAETIRLWQAAWDELSDKDDFASTLARGGLVASVTWPGALKDHVEKVASGRP